MSKDIHKLDGYESCVDAVFIYPNDGPFPSERPVLALWDEDSGGNDPHSKAPKIIQHVNACVVEPETPKALQAFKYVGYAAPAIEQLERYANSADEYYRGYSASIIVECSSDGEGLCFSNGSGMATRVNHAYPPEYDMSDISFPIGHAGAAISGPEMRTILKTDSYDGDSVVGYGNDVKMILDKVVDYAKPLFDGVGGAAEETFGGTLQVDKNSFGVDVRHCAHGIDLSTSNGQREQWPENVSRLKKTDYLAASCARFGVRVVKEYLMWKNGDVDNDWRESGTLCVRFDSYFSDSDYYYTSSEKGTKGLIVGFPTVKGGVELEFDVETIMGVEGQRTKANNRSESYGGEDCNCKVEGDRKEASIEDINSFEGSVLVAVPLKSFKNELIDRSTEWKFDTYENVLSGYSAPTATYTNEYGWRIEKQVQTVKVKVPESRVVMFYMCADPLWDGVTAFVKGASAESDCCLTTYYNKDGSTDDSFDRRYECVWGCASVDQVVRFCGSVIKIVDK